MARKRSYRRYYKRKGRWSANLQEIKDTTTISSNSTQGKVIDLCSNPYQTTTTVSQQYTAKNVEVSLLMETDSSTTQYYLNDAVFYIMYVPQGMSVGVDYPKHHPEYIMAYKYQGNIFKDDEPAGYNLRIKSRLARRLQTGDKIVLYYKCNNTSTSGSIEVRTSGIVRWWTKAN